MRSVHLADNRPKPVVLRCEKCSHEFPEREAATDERGDPRCPHCGSLRLQHAREHGGGLRRFLHRYSQV